MRGLRDMRRFPPSCWGSFHSVLANHVMQSSTCRSASQPLLSGVHLGKDRHELRESGGLLWAWILYAPPVRSRSCSCEKPRGPGTRPRACPRPTAASRRTPPPGCRAAGPRIALPSVASGPPVQKSFLTTYTRFAGVSARCLCIGVTVATYRGWPISIKCPSNIF